MQRNGVSLYIGCENKECSDLDTSIVLHLWRVEVCF